jgi:hypothetical protein
MKRGIFLAVLPMLAWLSIAVAMVLIDPDVRNKGAAYVDNHYRSSPDGKAHNSWSYAENTNPSLDSQGTSEPIRYLDRKSIQGAPESTRRDNNINYDAYTVYSH